MNAPEHRPDCLAATARPVARRRRRVRTVLLGTALVATLLAWLLREPLRHLIFEKGVLANDAPAIGLVEEMIEQAADRPTALLAAWNTGKIVHREAAMNEVSRAIPIAKPLPAEIETMVLAGSLDPDLDAREVALGILRDHSDPALAAVAAAQLRDLDPQVRLLGLESLKGVSANVGVPTVVALLEDSDPLIVATALRLLEHWSGAEFGVKVADTVPIENEKSGSKEFREDSRAKASAGARRAQAWWAKHEAGFPPINLEVPPATFAAQRPILAGDFQLPDLDGRKVRLSDFRGKVVLLNFWTTWCTACVSEMPELIALQKRHLDRLAILGVSLDFVPDEEHDAKLPSPEQIHRKVARIAKARGINYPILLDERNTVGGRFNGGELPTTVIIDAAGRIRRRFVGARSLPAFEAMIAEASQPLHPAAKTIQPPGFQ